MNSISIGLMIKDESEYISEWIKYYRWAGFDEILIIPHECKDNSVDVIRSTDPECKILDIEDCSCLGWNYKNTQYRKIIDNCYTEWLTILDIDEFVFTPNCTIKEFLGSYSKHISAIAMYQNIFGSNGHIEKPKGSVVQNYTRRNKDDILEDRKYPTFDKPQDLFKNIKPIFRVSHFSDIINSHDYKFKNGIINEDRSVYSRYRCNRKTQNIRMNHYFTKSLEDWNFKTSRDRLSKQPRYTQEWFDYCSNLGHLDNELANRFNIL